MKNYTTKEKFEIVKVLLKKTEHYYAVMYEAKEHNDADEILNDLNNL